MSTPVTTPLVPPCHPQYSVNDIVHITKSISATAAAGFGTAYPTNLELVPNTIWSIQEVKPSSTPGRCQYTAIPLTMTELTVDEAQLVLARIAEGAEVVKISEETQGLEFVYKVKEVRVVWDRDAVDVFSPSAKSTTNPPGAYCVMVRMLDEIGQLRDCKAEELRPLTDEEKVAGRRFWPTGAFSKGRISLV